MGAVHQSSMLLNAPSPPAPGHQTGPWAAFGEYCGFIRSKKVAPREIPAGSPLTLEANAVVAHAAGVWFDEPLLEEVILSDRYELGLSLLTFPRVSAQTDHATEEEPDLLHL